MKKRISDLMDCMERADLELNQETPLSSQRIKELTMNKITNKRKSRRTGFRVLVAAAVIAALTATVFAAGNVAGLLQRYFEEWADTTLTSGQVSFIEENEQIVEDIQNNHEWAVELKTYIATKATVYAVFGVTAPENMDIAGMGGSVFLETDVTGINGSSPHAYNIRIMNDGDVCSNTINYVYVMERGTDSHDINEIWNFHISSIYMSKYNESTQHVEFPVLTDGDWSFTIDLTEVNEEVVELISEPIETLANVYKKDPETDENVATLDYITVKSIQLSPLDVIILYGPVTESFAYFTGYVENTGIELHAYAIMKDGSAIPFRNGHPSFQGEARLIAESPIVIDEVECIFMPDGTKIMVP